MARRALKIPTALTVEPSWPGLPRPPAGPPSHLARLRDLDFEVLAWLDQAVVVDLPSAAKGVPRSEWLPRLAVAPSTGNSGYRLVEWLPKGHPANAYAFAGWHVADGQREGGVYQTIHAALGWFA